MRFSLVINFDYNTQLERFKSYCSVGFNGLTPEKKELLKVAIKYTQEKNASLDLDQFREVINAMRRCKTLDRDLKDTLKGALLYNWPAVFKDKEKQEALKDSPEAKHVDNDILKRYPTLNWLK